MKRVIFILLGLFTALSASAQSVYWNTATQKVEGNIYEIRFTATIAKGAHIYDLKKYYENGGPNETCFSFEGGDEFELEGEPYLITESKKKYDETFKMELGTLSGRALFGQKVKIVGDSAIIKGEISWQACINRNCLNPEQFDFEIKVKNEGNDSAILASETDSSDGADKSLWGLILEAILWGLMAIVTPCVFPMLPMTVSFFIKNGGRGRAIWYGLFIVVLYVLPIAILILGARLFGGDETTFGIFNWVSTHWIPNLIFFIVFMVFAASFFGAFEIVLPSGLANKTDAKSDKKGLMGVFFMALTLVLVSFSCTGPLVTSVFVRSVSGQFWTPILGITVFATVFALPFVFFAFFPSLLEKLPKSGGWFNTVKVVLGFVELALGLKFLSVADQVYHWGILDREIYLALWIVIFTLLGFYLLGKLKFKYDSEVRHIGIFRLVMAIASFTFVVYMLPGMWGAPLKGLSGYLPPITTQDFVLSSGGTAVVSNAEVSGRKYADFLPASAGLDVFFEYNEAQEYANGINKPLMLYFTGRGCVNCREMESRVWSEEGVKSILARDYVIAELFIDDRKTLPESDWVTLPNGKVLKTLGRINTHWAIENYKVVSQPTYIVVDREGRPLLPARGYNLNIEEYIAFLNKGIESYFN